MRLEDDMKTSTIDVAARFVPFFSEKDVLHKVQEGQHVTRSEWTTVEGRVRALESALSATLCELATRADKADARVLQEENFAQYSSTLEDATNMFVKLRKRVEVYDESKLSFLQRLIYAVRRLWNKVIVGKAFVSLDHQPVDTTAALVKICSWRHKLSEAQLTPQPVAEEPRAPEVLGDGRSTPPLPLAWEEIPLRSPSAGMVRRLSRMEERTDADGQIPSTPLHARRRANSFSSPSRVVPPSVQPPEIIQKTQSGLSINTVLESQVKATNELEEVYKYLAEGEKKKVWLFSRTLPQMMRRYAYSIDIGIGRYKFKPFTGSCNIVYSQQRDEFSVTIQGVKYTKPTLAALAEAAGGILPETILEEVKARAPKAEPPPSSPFVGSIPRV
jgi:hypothetical protein